MKPRSLAFTLSLAVAALGRVDGVQAQLSQAESPAFQGHSAEMQLRTEEEERRRRALFFDGVRLEIGKPEVPCDHLARSKPHAVAGSAYVVILGLLGRDEDRLRVWLAPGSTQSADEALEKAHDLAGQSRQGAVHILIDMRRFLACR